jgi:hypothetical protein
MEIAILAQEEAEPKMRGHASDVFLFTNDFQNLLAERPG